MGFKKRKDTRMVDNVTRSSKNWPYNEWLNTRDAEDRKLYAIMNKEVKRVVTKRLWKKRCEELDRCMGGTKISEA